MRKLTSLFTVAAVIVSIFVSSEALAKDPLPGLKPDKNTGMVTSVKAGEVVEFRLAVDAQGSFTAPQGWTTRFSTTKKGGGPLTCAPDRPVGCGVWIATAPVSATGNFTFSYTPPTGTSSNYTAIVNVEQPPAPPPPVTTGSWYPADKGTALEGRVTTLEKSKESVTAFIHYQGIPNLPTTTAMGHGVILGFSALVVDQGPAARFSVGGKFAYARTSIPIDMALKPVVTEGSEDRYTGAFTLGWTPCVQLEDAGSKRDFWCFNAGALAGFQAYSYSSTFNRAIRNGAGQLENVEFVRERTQYAFMMGPEVSTTVHITRNFGLGLGFSLPIDITSVSRTIGEGSGGGQVANGEARGAPQANPTFHGGLDFFF